MRCCARALAVAAVLHLAAAATVRAQLAPSSNPVTLLDVPYLQQSEALCGGAAVAMVMRYWGATGVYAETFAPLVDKAAGGIRGEALLRDLTGRGWDARSFRGDPPLVQARLAVGQPVIALIEDRPGIFHYVVVVAWTKGQVIHHDPARAPFRVVSEASFIRAWEASGYWTLLALPPAASGSPRTDPSSNRIGSSPERLDSSGSPSACSGLVDEGVRLATNGDPDAALRTLAAARDACPHDSAPWREMAGVHALKDDWRAAAIHARQAVRRDANDAHAWRILATSSYLTDDSAQALEAWNAVGEPVIEIVNVRGLEHTRHAVATAALRLDPQTVLTRATLSAAAKRLSEIPAAQVARVSYRPLENGRASVEALLIERSRSPFSLTGLAVIGLRALSNRELSAASANPTGAGDLMTATWRWWENRPRLAASYAAPLSFGGVLRTDVFRDEQTYGIDRIREVRKGGAAAFSDWTATGLRWEVGIGLDAWSGRRKTVAVATALEQRLGADRLAVEGRATLLSGGNSAWAASAAVEWRSSLRHDGHVLLGRAGADFAAIDAPLALWTGAGLGHARPALLRAHSLLDDGVIAGDVFGRRLYAGGGEWRRWTKPLKGAIRVAPAIFIDTARAEQRLAPGSAWHLDAGAGIRVAIPGSQVLRVDLAKGMRDGTTVLSVGWTR